MSYNKTIVPFIKSQIPDHILDSDSLFPDFVEAYYEWLNSPLKAQNTLYSISNVTDIDKSLTLFIDEFFNEYLNNFPKDFLTDKSLTIKHIIDLYKAKGTPAGYKLLFKILFNKDIDIYYPADYIFRPSDNTWIQDITFFVTVQTGDISTIVGKDVNVLYNGKNINIFVDRVRHVQGSVYQIYYSKSRVQFGYESTISYNGFYAKLTPTTVKATIKRGGAGFHVGQVFDVTDGFGTVSSLKITKVDLLGAVQKAEFIEFGYGFKSNFDVNLSTATAVYTDTAISGSDTSVHDYITSISDSGYVTRSNYFASDYAENTYTGEIVATFEGNTATADDPTSCIIGISIGTIAKYAGHWENNRSFSSDTVYLQDGNFYQIYSYVIKSEIEFYQYKELIKKLIHPAGIGLFGQYEIVNRFDINTSLRNILNFFSLKSVDEITIDDLIAIDFSKPLTDSVSVSENYSINATKPIADSVTPADTNTLSVAKPVSDSATASDDISDFSMSKYVSGTTEDVYAIDTVAYNMGKSYTDSATASDSIANTVTKPITDSATASDVISNSITKPFSDLATASDAVNKTVTKSLTDSASMSDSISTLFGKSLADSSTPVDSISNTITKPFSDSSTASDSVTSSFGKSLSDSASTTDNINSFDINKVLAESVSVVDLMTTVFGKSVSDSITTDDAVNTNIGKNISDSATASDDISDFSMSKYVSGTTEDVYAIDTTSYTFGTAFADSVTVTDVIDVVFGVFLSDSAAATDASSISISKAFADSATSSDLFALTDTHPVSDTSTVSDVGVLSIGKNLSEDVSATDIGEGWLNPYAEPGYFAEEYSAGKFTI